MDAMNTPTTKLPTINQVSKKYSLFQFKKSDAFYWAPEYSCINYIENSLFSKKGWFQLFHELGHAVCGHQTFSSGVQLLKIEAEAWHKAIELADSYGVVITSAYIQAALDSYRDWLHQRSLCPQCSVVSVETKPSHYHCFKCAQSWTVPVHQQTRSYRKRTK